RLSAAAVSMSLTGSCFSSESAPRPFHHGIRRRGGAIFWSALPSDERQVQADMRTHLIHRPARDIIPPFGGARVSSYLGLILGGLHAAAAPCSRVQRGSRGLRSLRRVRHFMLPAANHAGNRRAEDGRQP